MNLLIDADLDKKVEHRELAMLECKCLMEARKPKYYDEHLVRKNRRRRDDERAIEEARAEYNPREFPLNMTVNMTLVQTGSEIENH